MRLGAEAGFWEPLEVFITKGWESDRFAFEMRVHHAIKLSHIHKAWIKSRAILSGGAPLPSHFSM